MRSISFIASDRPSSQARMFVRRGVSLLPVFSLAGCARSPEFNVLGSYFPGWIACMLLGVIVAVLVHVVLQRRQMEARIAALPLFYLSVVMLVASAFWLVTFE